MFDNSEVRSDSDKTPAVVDQLKNMRAFFKNTAPRFRRFRKNFGDVRAERAWR